MDFRKGDKVICREFTDKEADACSINTIKNCSTIKEQFINQNATICHNYGDGSCSISLDSNPELKTAWANCKMELMDGTSKPIQFQKGDQALLSEFTMEERDAACELSCIDKSFCMINKGFKEQFINKIITIHDIVGEGIITFYNCGGTVAWPICAIKKVILSIPQGTKVKQIKLPEDTMHPIDRAFYEDRISAMKTATDTMGPNGGPKMKPVVWEPTIQEQCMKTSDALGNADKEDKELRKYTGY